MARVDLERKQRTRWPWLAGVGVLLVIVWAISGLLAGDPQTEPEVVVPTIEDTQPPAGVPAPPNASVHPTRAARGLEEIAPLGEEDVGQTVRMTGEVVATGNTGFWLLAGDAVVRIDSDRQVRKGDSLSVEGTLRIDDAARIDRVAEMLDGRPGSHGWNVIDSVKLVEEREEPADPRA